MAQSPIVYRIIRNGQPIGGSIYDPWIGQVIGWARKDRAIRQARELAKTNRADTWEVKAEYHGGETYGPSVATFHKHG